MTAIIGYTNKNNGNKIGLLCADNLEGLSKTKVDKLIKINDRFVLAFTGLEALHWAVDWFIVYFQQFNKSKLNSINEVEDILNEIIPHVFKRWKEVKYFDNIEVQKKLKSTIIALDIETSTLYFGDAGKVWEIDNDEIQFSILPDGLHSFGIVTNNQGFQSEEYNESDMKKIFLYLDEKFALYQHLHPGYVGNLGMIQITFNGREEFNSSFDCYKDFLENLITRNIKQKQK